MRDPRSPERRRVAIIGGGLAGIATAWFLRGCDAEVTLFEARHVLGGRLRSVQETITGQLIDTCQHVALGCCREFLRFCRQTGVWELFERHRTIFFVGIDGNICRFTPFRAVPAPFHLLPAVLKFSILTPLERSALVRAAWKLSKLSRTQEGSVLPDNIASVLRRMSQSDRLIDTFWFPLLVSATGETLDRIPVSLAGKIIREAFFASRKGCELWIPKVPLRKLCDFHLRRRLEEAGIRVAPGQSVRALTQQAGEWLVHLAHGQAEASNGIVLAVPWWTAVRLLPEHLASHVLPGWREAGHHTRHSPEACAITGVHLWFDRPGPHLPHAVLPFQLSQWVFRPPFVGDVSEPEPATPVQKTSGTNATPWYCQVVVSASHRLAPSSPEECARRVVDELKAVFPVLRPARLLASRVITEPAAVLSPDPAWECRRPPQDTGIPGLVLVGDWTATGWPGTMESAVRSARSGSEIMRQYLQSLRSTL